MDYDFPAFKILNISEAEYEKRKERRAKNIYQDIVEPALEQGLDSTTVFQPKRIQDEIRPPYSYTEVKNALEYGAQNSDDFHLLESDMDLYLIEE